MTNAKCFVPALLVELKFVHLLSDGLVTVNNLRGGQECAVRSRVTPPYNIQERTFQFSIRIVQLCRRTWGCHEVTRLLVRQLVRSATSVGANLQEADGGQTRPDFITKVATAKKEAKEAVYWLRLIAATEPALQDHMTPLLDEAKQIEAVVSAILRNARTNRKRA